MSKAKQKMSKAAAIKAAQKSVKSKKTPAKKTSKSKSTALASTAEVMEPKKLEALRVDADRIMNEEIPADLLGIGKSSVALHVKIEDAMNRELWKFCSTPYKSWSAYIKHIREQVGKSATTLFGIVGLVRALPGETAESRAAIPKRQAEQLKRAKKAKERKGDRSPLPKSVVEAAKKQSPAELDKTLDAQGLSGGKQKRKGKSADKPDPLLFHPESGDKFSGPGRGHAEVVNGGSGKVEGAPASAGQYCSIIEQAIEVACKIYGLSDKSAALKLIAGEWLNGQCSTADAREFNWTNLEAFEHLEMKAKA